MEQYLIDTNVISDYFSASLPASGLLFMDSVIDAVPNLSVISLLPHESFRVATIKLQQLVHL